MNIINACKTTKPLLLYTPVDTKWKKIQVYIIPKQSNVGIGKKAFIPFYPDSFFKSAKSMDSVWLVERMKDIAAVNLQPQTLILDNIEHSQKNYEMAEHFAILANNKGGRINLNALKTLSYAHDIGRTSMGGKSPRFLETMGTAYHGVIGREIFIHFSQRFASAGRQNEARFCLSLAKMCSAHNAGVGFIADHNQRLGILPHGKTQYEDDLVWGEPLDHYFERLLIGVADAKNFHPLTKFQYKGNVILSLNNKPLIELSEGNLIIDGGIKKIYIKSGATLKSLNYHELCVWNPEDALEIKTNDQKMILQNSLAGIPTLKIENGDTVPLPGFELMSINKGTISAQECYFASRKAVHVRFDRWSPNNKTNIDRAFDEVIKLVGKENRHLVDNGWFDEKKIPL